ncbi:hypothetical protein [Thermococcus sp.]|uniref:hypothetical protein n=1 Tax=Thermococcus sp. TaxID=35749 RepID=UPI00260C2B1E|nr:hypothetical protein [Thermococcus sp.]
MGNEKDSIVATLLVGSATWGLIFLFLTRSIVPSAVMGFGAGLLTLARSVERFRDLLVRGLGFALLGAGVLIFKTGAWYRSFIAVSLFWVGFLYALAYIGVRRYESDFVERNLLAFALMGFLFAFLLTYPDTARALSYVIYLLASGAIVYLTYLVSSYIGTRLGRDERIQPLPLPTLETRRDLYAHDIRRIYSSFVEKGEKAPLVVFLVRNAPDGIDDGQLARILRPIIEYSPPRFSPLTPQWVVEKKLNDERARRARILLRVLRSLGVGVGTE